MPKGTKQELEYKALNTALKHIATKFSNLRFPVDSNERVPEKQGEGPWKECKSGQQ